MLTIYVLTMAKLARSDFPNVHVIGNRLIHDKDGYFIAVQEPVIHVYNKNEASILHHNNNPWIKSIKHRRNIILLGDSLGRRQGPLTTILILSR